MVDRKIDGEMEEIDFAKIEKKWQKKWEGEKVFEVSEETDEEKYYVLEMYPYPSDSGLHMGHAFNYTIGDILARFKRMQGFNVLYPMGYDSFGLPAENAAIKQGKNPKEFTESSIKNFVQQQKALGLSYDWSRILWSHDPEYYKWNQWIFLKMMEKGLAYRKKSPVNYCPKCETVLANEQVHNGRCWRHEDTEVVVKHLEQWFLRTTEYADELLEGVKKLDWPERIKTMQKNWIGKSPGVEIVFDINGEPWKVFTTRADTLFGVTFMVVSAQHPKLMDLVTEERKEEVEDFVKKSKGIKQEDIDRLDKEGVFTGSYAKHPITGEDIPVWAGNFVVADYGSGMVMAVPGHDQRDYEFAKKYELEIKNVVSPEDGGDVGKDKAFVDYGVLINSGEFDGLKSGEAIEHIAGALKAKGLGEKTVEYKLRDWLVSRQRYWGTPIPVIYCDKCGIQGVPEEDLPVELPEKVEFGKGNPLKKMEEWVNVQCPNCGRMGKRETDTMDTFFDSSWYYLRYCDSKNKKTAFDIDNVKYWMPVDFYTGGAEHACMHLIYARFFTKFLRDYGVLEFGEPFTKLFNQGMLHGDDGFVMSKSRGNGVDPLEIVEKYGADSLRLFLVSVASPDKDFSWSQTGIEGSWKFVRKVFNFVKNVEKGKSSQRMEHKINKAIKGIGEDIENLGYNYAVIKLRKLFESMEREEQIAEQDLESFVKMFSVFCPHVGEELWDVLGRKGFISLEAWPECEKGKIDEEIDKEEEIVEKTVGDILNIIKLVKEKQGKDVKKVYLYVIPKEYGIFDVGELRDRVGKEVVVYSVDDKTKVDPEGKAGKAKPGKPGIFVE
jgi:leucyl-tRNA synthetase